MRRLWRKWYVAGPLLLLLVGLIGLIVLSRWPGVAARFASPLRRVVGNQGVAQLETAFFTVQDGLRQVQYDLGLAEPAAPFVPAATATSRPLPTATATRMTPTTTARQVVEADSPAGTATLPPATATPTVTPPPTATPVPQWTLPPLPPLGTLAGEGAWEPYLTNMAGEVVAVRTFLQPDEERPYAIVAIVAFNLAETELHYVLGAEEPALLGGPHGDGRIPEADRRSGRLLATFNGGFLATHGEYGAMSGGLEALPAKPGYGTVAAGEDGRLQVGEWGTDVDPAGAYRFWRQNARMVVHNGEINERVYNGSIITWGGSINGDIVTWRSGIGLDAAGEVLYFFAGPSLSMPVLAEAMQTAGAHNSILLDINASWVHFAAIRSTGETLTAEPLFAEGMETNVDRYLLQSSRDFFYVTAGGGD